MIYFSPCSLNCSFSHGIVFIFFNFLNIYEASICTLLCLYIPAHRAPAAGWTLLQPQVLLPERINGHRLLGVRNSHHDFLIWLSWFSNTGIDVSLSLKGVLLTSFLASFHPPYPPFLSLLSSSTTKPGRLLQLSASSILRQDQYLPAAGQGYVQSHFQFPPMQKASMHSCPLWMLQWTHSWTCFFLL